MLRNCAVTSQKTLRVTGTAQSVVLQGNKGCFAFVRTKLNTLMYSLGYILSYWILKLARRIDTTRLKRITVSENFESNHFFVPSCFVYETATKIINVF